jgi:hypothetical protein
MAFGQTQSEESLRRFSGNRTSGFAGVILISAFQPQFEKSVNCFAELGTHFDLDKIKNIGRPF